MPNWSLENELCIQTGTTDAREALHNLGLIAAKDTNFAIRRDHDWLPCGHEAYVYRFWIRQENGPEQGYLVKACTTPPGVWSLSEVMQQWIARRRLLANSGVATPRLLSVKGATLLEELIPYRLEEIVTRARKPPVAMLRQIAYCIGVLNRLGFVPTTTLLGDLHSRGDDVVVVDFGQNLGPLGVEDRRASGGIESSGFALYDTMVEELRAWGVQPDESLLAELRFWYVSFDPDSESSRA